MTATPPDESEATQPDPSRVTLCSVTGLANVNRLVDELANNGVAVSTNLPADLAPEVAERVRVSLVVNASDLDRARRVLMRLHESTHVRPGTERPVCVRCRYELTHLGEVGQCPECGTEIFWEAEASGGSEWRCPTCGENVPGTFESCWACTADVPPEPETDIGAVFRDGSEIGLQIAFVIGCLAMLPLALNVMRDPWNVPYEPLVLDIAVTITIAVVLVRRRQRQNES